MKDKDPNFMTLIEIAYEYKKKALLMAEFKQIWLTYENGYKVKRAQLIRDLRALNPDLSEARLEHEALGSESYAGYMQEWSNATGQYLRADIDARAWELYWKSRQTMEATKREEIKHDVQS